MGNNNGQLQLEKQKQQQIEIREHLNQLQNWDVAPDQTLEERRQQHNSMLLEQQKQDSEILSAKMKDKLGEINVEKTAQGSPVQTQAPAQETWKQRNERKKKDKKAKKMHPDADHVSYDMVEKLNNDWKGTLNSFGLSYKNEKGEFVKISEQVEKERVDDRVLRCFCNGYQKDKKGRPATDKDRENMQRDATFLVDYCSKDLKKRTPHLDRMCDELLSYNISKEVLTPDYICKNIIAMNKMCSRMVYMENVMRDPINAPYFEKMNPLRRKLLEELVINRYAEVSSYVSGVVACKGVHLDKAEYLNKDVPNYIKEMTPGFRDAMNATLDKVSKNVDAAVGEAFEKEFEEAKALEMENAENMKEQAGGLGYEGINMTSFVTGYSFDEMKKYREMIESHPEEYAQNKELIDKVFQNFYRSMDSMGDLTLVSKACQYVMDTHNMNQAQHKLEDKMISAKAVGRMEECSKQIKSLQMQLSAMTEIMQHYLRGKEMTERAKLQLDHLGLAEKTE